MKTLEEHNAMRFALHAELNSNKPRRNGIACPNCHAELFDSDPRVTLTSWPPQKAVHCDQCGHKGYRIA